VLLTSYLTLSIIEAICLSLLVINMIGSRIRMLIEEMNQLSQMVAIQSLKLSLVLSLKEDPCDVPRLIFYQL
jgi:hypothetical protein